MDSEDLSFLAKHEISRRDLLLDGLGLGGFLAASLAMPLSAWGTTKQHFPPEQVRIGYLPIADATALLVAHAKGYLQDQGLNVAEPEPVSSWTRLIQGFVAGKYNLVHFLNPIPIWLRYNHHIPIKIVSWAHINGSAVVVGEHSNINSFADFGGKQVAVPYWYSMHNVLLQMALRQAGLTPVIKSKYEKLASYEVNLKILPPQLMVWALKANNIDAYIVAEPLNAEGELVAGGRLLRFTGDIWKNHPCCVVCMNEQDISDRSAWSQKIVNAMVRAQIFAQQDKPATAKLLSQAGQGYIPASEQVLQRAMLSYADLPIYLENKAIMHPEWGNGRIDFAPYPYPSATHLLVNSMNQTLVGSRDVTFLDQLNADFVTQDLVDYQFIKQAMQAYSGWEQAPGVDPNSPYEREEIIMI